MLVKNGSQTDFSLAAIFSEVDTTFDRYLYRRAENDEKEDVTESYAYNFKA